MNQLDESWGLTNPELLQQFAMLQWIGGSMEGKDMLENITKMRIGYELYDRVSNRRELDALQKQTIGEVCDYIKSHPQATEDQMVQAISKIIQAFVEKVKTI